MLTSSNTSDLHERLYRRCVKNLLNANFDNLANFWNKKYLQVLIVNDNRLSVYELLIGLKLQWKLRVCTYYIWHRSYCCLVRLINHRTTFFTNRHGIILYCWITYYESHSSECKRTEQIYFRFLKHSCKSSKIKA
jgi:hypothetical protein